MGMMFPSLKISKGSFVPAVPGEAHPRHGKRRHKPSLRHFESFSKSSQTCSGRAGHPRSPGRSLPLCDVTQTPAEPASAQPCPSCS